MFNLSFNAWDIALIAVVVVQSTLLAYCHHPKWKALLLTLPVPFTMATMAVGRPVDVTNAAGLLNLLLFISVVRWLHIGAGVQIVAAIIAAGCAYFFVGISLAAILPATEAAFWIASALVLGVGVVVLRAMPHRDDPGHRSSLPVWVKAPIIAAVVIFLILMKKLLKGFLPLFPMVTVIAAYEARHSLWTMCRQIDIVLLLFMPTLVAMHLVQLFKVAIGPSLGVAWIVFLALLLPMLRRQWARQAPAADD